MSERRFISMLSDYGFKVTFGNQQRTTFLRRALSALIVAEAPIERVLFVRNEVSGLTRWARGGLYDVACQDERGRTFIVEMQVVGSPEFIHRAKFYAFHKYNEMIRKGQHYFRDLPQIYTISILSGRVYRTELYHQIINLKNQEGTLVDDQITHVIVELGKFNKTLSGLETDLDKLLYTMKTTDKMPKESEQPAPDFWQEDWLKEALYELDHANLTPEQYSQYAMTIARVASDRYELRRQFREEMGDEIRAEVEEEIRRETEARVKRETEARVKREQIIKALRQGLLTDEQIAALYETTVDEVARLRREAQ